jgi:acyl-CoA synthetase (AMP-forming)/AMP-acid ligase II/acyl carrier protein
MAESTLILTGAKESGPTVYLPVKIPALEKNFVVPVSNNDPPGDIQWIASNGKPTMDTSVRIMDPETGVVQQPNRIGEIWASGSTITLGYYGKPDLTENIFRVSPAGEDDPVWLRTGDLGFIYNGELFITGRLKDLIIVHGRNFYPQDIEEVVETSHSSIRKSCSAAFPVDSGGRERLAIVAELRRTLLPPDTEKIIEAIVAAVSREFELQPARIALIKTGALIKTSSGKIMRHANRESLLAETFDSIADRSFEEAEVIRTDPGEVDITNLEKFLVAWTSLRLNKGEPVNPANSLPSYGIDSIRAVELTEETKNIFGFEWPPYLFFEEISLVKLAEEGLKLMEEE